MYVFVVVWPHDLGVVCLPHLVVAWSSLVAKFVNKVLNS